MHILRYGGCSAMHHSGHRPVKAVILLWPALHPAARGGGVVTWHCTEKCIREVFVVFW
jgi:hypothetical protein